MSRDGPAKKISTLVPCGTLKNRKPLRQYTLGTIIPSYALCMGIHITTIHWGTIPSLRDLPTVKRGKAASLACASEHKYAVELATGTGICIDFSIVSMQLNLPERMVSSLTFPR